MANEIFIKMAACRHLGFYRSWKVTLEDVAGMQAVYGNQRNKYGEDISNSGWVMAIFRFSKWWPATILDFVTGQKWRHGTLRTVHVYHRAKFGDNILNGGRVIAIFRFPKWRPSAILDFVLAQKWHPRTLWAVHGHQRTKFREDISSSGWVVDIFRFQNGGRRHLGFCWILFSDHPRSLSDDLKLCLKFYVDQIYTFEDVAISIFGNFT